MQEEVLSNEAQRKIFGQVQFLANNAIETRSGRYMCFYHRNLLIAETPQQLHLLLDCIWR